MVVGEDDGFRWMCLNFSFGDFGVSKRNTSLLTRFRVGCKGIWKIVAVTRYSTATAGVLGSEHPYLVPSRLV
jgi:hypothetical protein